MTKIFTQDSLIPYKDGVLVIDRKDEQAAKDYLTGEGYR
jgi:hypothetical protein